MAYADFWFYTEHFGGVIPQAEFKRFAERATAYINALTMGKVTEPVSDGVKNAVCGIAEEYYREHLRGGAASETNDGYSVSFDRAADARISEIARVYLQNSGLLYRGMM